MLHKVITNRKNSDNEGLYFYRIRFLAASPPYKIFHVLRFSFYFCMTPPREHSREKKAYIDMKLFTTPSIKLLDQLTTEYEPITSIGLMERAAEAITQEISKIVSPERHIYIFAGPGNNGGDALATARLLIDLGYRPIVYLFNTSPSHHLSADCAKNRDRLKNTGTTDFFEITNQFTPPVIEPDDVIIDGLFGAGLREPLTGGFASLVRYINETEAFVISIDIPSGLFGEWNPDASPDRVVKAHLTLTLQTPKLAFFFAENTKYTGQVKVLDIALHPRAIAETETGYYLTTVTDVATRLHSRAKFSDKRDYGHLLLAAGQYSMMGAAILASKAALHSGAGLVSVHAPRCANLILQTAVPEAIFSPDKGEEHIEEIPANPRYTALAVGPGMGCNETSIAALLHLLKEIKQPLVLDADALNCIAQEQSILRYLPSRTILTPHIHELERMFGPMNSDADRLKCITHVATKYDIIVVLKGAHTAIALPDGSVHFNSTGNPGMATAGSGDVLTGIIGSLLAQGYPPEEAAIIGVFLHGTAGDLASQEEGEEYVTAGDIVAHLGKAFKQIKATRM